MKISQIRPEVYDMAKKAQERAGERFERIDQVAEENTRRVMEAFQEERVADACFAGTTGYGYDDLGRETLDRIYARIFGAEAALVRIGFVNGTHALCCGLFALADPGQKILSVTGAPYDTLRTAIGIEGRAHGSLMSYGIGYSQVDLLPGGDPDIEGIKKALEDESIAAVILQRSRGYEDRRALTIEDIELICRTVKALRPQVKIMVDNCYGEFTSTREPCHVGADLVAGSLIKNPGGGLAPSGGYLAGTRELVDKAAMRLTSPGIGGECGASLGHNRLLFQGLFMAPHIVSQALKTAVFCAAMMEQLGLESSPSVDDERSDIIQMVKLGSEENMCRFCAGIQAGAPVDSYVTPVPWDMPGYNCQVIMAAGSFVQGSSIELSADGPIREPYAVYMQGGLTYASGKLGVMMAVSAMLEGK